MLRLGFESHAEGTQNAIREKAYDEAISSAYSFSEPRDSCHFGLVWTHREPSSTMRSRFDGYDDEQSIIAIAIRLYCNYGGGVVAQEDRQRGLPSSRRCFLRVYLRSLYLCLPDEDRSELLQRFLRSLSLQITLRFILEPRRTRSYATC